jgi:hypothetical protein
MMTSPFRLSRNTTMTNDKPSISSRGRNGSVSGELFALVKENGLCWPSLDVDHARQRSCDTRGAESFACSRL